MKKRIITLGLCLTISAACAFADCTQPQKNNSKQNTAAVTAPTCPSAMQHSEKCKKENCEEQIKKDREELYCKLSLTDEQKAKAEAIFQKMKDSSTPLIDKLQKEKAKLRGLKNKKACKIRIDEQKLKVKLAKKALKKHVKKSIKEFEAILNKEQLEKFEVIRKEKKEEWKEFKGHHHHDCGGHDKDNFLGEFEHNKNDSKQKCPLNK